MGIFRCILAFWMHSRFSVSGCVRPSVTHTMCHIGRFYEKCDFRAEFDWGSTRNSGNRPPQRILCLNSVRLVCKKVFLSVCLFCVCLFCVCLLVSGKKFQINLISAHLIITFGRFTQIFFSLDRWLDALREWIVGFTFEFCRENAETKTRTVFHHLSIEAGSSKPFKDLSTSWTFFKLYMITKLTMTLSEMGSSLSIYWSICLFVSSWVSLFLLRLTSWSFLPWDACQTTSMKFHQLPWSFFSKPPYKCFNKLKFFFREGATFVIEILWKNIILFFWKNSFSIKADNGKNLQGRPGLALID